MMNLLLTATTQATKEAVEIPTGLTSVSVISMMFLFFLIGLEYLSWGRISKFLVSCILFIVAINYVYFAFAK